MEQLEHYEERQNWRLKGGDESSVVSGPTAMNDMDTEVICTPNPGNQESCPQVLEHKRTSLALHLLKHLGQQTLHLTWTVQQS